MRNSYELFVILDGFDKGVLIKYYVDEPDPSVGEYAPRVHSIEINGNPIKGDYDEWEELCRDDYIDRLDDFDEPLDSF